MKRLNAVRFRYRSSRELLSRFSLNRELLNRCGHPTKRGSMSDLAVVVNVTRRLEPLVIG